MLLWMSTGGCGVSVGGEVVGDGSVDFAGDAFWKELQQLHRDGKLAPEMSRLYFAEHRSMFELYDLEADPAELKNLVGDEGSANLLKELKAALQEWMILQRDYVPLPVPPPAPARRAGG